MTKQETTTDVTAETSASEIGRRRAATVRRLREQRQQLHEEAQQYGDQDFTGLTTTQAASLVKQKRNVEQDAPAANGAGSDAGNQNPPQDAAPSQTPTSAPPADLPSTAPLSPDELAGVLSSQLAAFLGSWRPNLEDLVLRRATIRPESVQNLARALEVAAAEAMDFASRLRAPVQMPTAPVDQPPLRA